MVPFVPTYLNCFIMKVVSSKFGKDVEEKCPAFFNSDWHPESQWTKPKGCMGLWAAND